VRDLVTMLRENDWVEVRQVGSHRQFKHPVRLGLVTVSGQSGDEVPLGTLRSVYRQAGLDSRDRRT